MKKNMLRVVLFIMLIMLPSSVFSGNWLGKNGHKAVWELADKIPKKYGGFGGWFSRHPNGKLVLEKLQDAIDGTGGSKHRHDGSHNPLILFSSIPKTIAEYNIPEDIVIKAVIIHNLVDMDDPGPEGTNGWEVTPERKAEAEKLLSKIKSGKGFKVPPKWAHIAGTEVVPKITMLTKVKSFISDSKYITKTKNYLSKITVVVEKLPKYTGYTIYAVYEGSTTGYNLYKEPEKWKNEVKRSISIIVGFVGAEGGAIAGTVA